MPLTPGTRLGIYEIVAPLGAGGMGEVYRARDARLGRDVAIKVLNAAFTGDAERRARFEREAKLLASMSHSGIGAIYGLEETEGHPALIMELVEGSTLAERLASEPLEEDEALSVARQLADALEYAHDRGIVHRDLKPANIKLRPDGVVKILDFGLARALDVDTAGRSDLSQSPTITNRMTVAGVILGTAAYMAPEQARGREVDRRADIWAFGAVLFEMLTGRRAFEGETVSDMLAAVMRDDPDWAALPPDLSARWRRLIGRCLTKDPRARLQAIGEARIALSDAAELPGASTPGPTAVPVRTAKARGVRLAIFGALAGVLLGVAGALFLRPNATQLPGATELSMMLPFGQRFGGDVGYHFFAISPDGRAMAYSARSGAGFKMHVRRLDRREDIELPGTEGARNMFFSPDGEWIGFFNSLTLSKVSIHGGSPVVLTPARQDRGGTWLHDGTIVFSSDTTVPLAKISGAGGTPVNITTLDLTRHERTHRFPNAIDGGPWVVFTVGRTESPGGYDDSRIDAVNVKTGERRELVNGARRAVWAPPGYLVFHRLDDLYAMRLNPRNPRPGPEPLPVQDGVAGEASSGAAFFEFSKDGTLAWVRAEAGGDQRDIGWYDREGRWTPSKLPPGPYLTVTLSPDGNRVLICAGAGGGSSDLWVGDLVNGAMNRLTYGNSANPGLWLPDGRSMVFPKMDSTGTTIVVRRLDDVGVERVLYHAPTPLFVTSLTLGGKKVVISDYGVAGGHMRTANLEGAPDVSDLPADPGTRHSEQAGVVSPDGRWLAYVSNRTQREEVYVRSVDGTGGRWQVSTGGGGGVRWGRDSHELFFVEGGVERVMRVSLEERGTELVVGQPEPLFEAPPSPMEPTYRDQDYDRLHDRFLFTRPPFGSNERREIALSLGWTSGLASKLRAGRAAK